MNKPSYPSVFGKCLLYTLLLLISISAVMACFINDSTLTNVTIDENGTHRNPCRIINSTLIDVFVNSSRIYSSYVDPTIVIDSYISNSTVINSTVEYSTVIDSIFCGNFTVFGASVDNDILMSGRIGYLGGVYYGPMALTTICALAGDAPVGILSINDTLVNNTASVLFSYAGDGVGYIVSLNASPLYNQTIFLSDLDNNAIYTNTTIVDYLGNGEYTLNATIDDRIGHIFYATTNVTVDNTAPLLNMTVMGSGGYSNLTESRVVFIDFNISDAYGYDICRFANDLQSNIDSANWEICIAPRSWVLTSTTGNKTVYMQAMDYAGNTIIVNSSIFYNTSTSGAAGASAPVVYDSATGLDVDWWNQNTTYSAYWFNSTGSGTVQYRYRLIDNGSCYQGNCTYVDVGQSTEVTLTGLVLEEGHNYSMEIEAYNGAGSTTATSNGSITDFTNPTLAAVNSTTHPNVSATYTNGTVFMTFNSTDLGLNASGIDGFSYLLNTLPGTAPDNNIEGRYWSTIMTSQNNGAGQELKENSTGPAYAVFAQLADDVTQNDSIRVNVKLAEQLTDLGDTMQVKAYMISVANGAGVGVFSYNMLANAISDQVEMDRDIKYEESLLSASTYSFELTINTTVLDSANDIYVVIMGNSSDDNNRHNFSLAATDDPAIVDNTTSVFICDESSACTDNSTTQDFAIEIKREDSGNNWFTRYDNLQDGTYYFHVKAADRAGNWGDPAHYQLNIDTAGIGVVINSPYSGQLFNYNPVDVLVEVNEPGFVQIVTMHEDGSSFNTSIASVNTTYTFQTTLENGTNTIYAIGNDSLGQVTYSLNVYALYGLFAGPVTNKTLYIDYSNADSLTTHIRFDDSEPNYIAGIATENDGAAFTATSISSDTSDHYSKIFMTKKTWSSSSIEQDIEDNDFMDRVNPMFGFVRGAEKYLVGAELRYVDIWFDGDRKVTSGKYTFVFRNEGMTADDKANISVSVN